MEATALWSVRRGEDPGLGLAIQGPGVKLAWCHSHSAEFTSLPPPNDVSAPLRQNPLREELQEMLRALWVKKKKTWSEWVRERGVSVWGVWYECIVWEVDKWTSILLNSFLFSLFSLSFHFPLSSVSAGDFFFHVCEFSWKLWTESSFCLFHNCLIKVISLCWLGVFSASYCSVLAS